MTFTLKLSLMIAFLLAAVLQTSCGVASSSPKGPKAPKMDVLVNVPGGESDLRLYQLMEAPIIDYSQLTVEARKGRKNCAINRPTAGAKIVNINSYTSSTRRGSPITAVRSYENRRTKEQEIKVTSYYRSKIIITDTSAPIYIVAGTYENTIWEIFTAPGVKLDGMLLVGHEPQAVVNTNIRSSRISFISLSDPLHKNCYVGASRPSQSEPKEYQDWRKYISRKLGRSPAEVVNDYGIDAVLIGPVPDFTLPGTYTDHKIIRHDSDDRTLIFNHYDYAEAQAKAWIEAGKTDF